jgi:NADH-quinone oxidoreductase subunit N
MMNMAAFAVIAARERETGLGDSIEAVTGLGRERPLLAWPLTLSMLGLAGIPATAGLIGKIYLIDAAVNGGYAWLGVVIVVGSMLSLGYYLPVIAAVWMRDAPSGAPRAGSLPALAGGSPELDPQGPGTSSERREGPPSVAAAGTWELSLVAVVAGAATLFFGVVPQPLFDLVHRAGSALGLF